MNQYLEDFLQNTGPQEEGFHSDTFSVTPATIAGRQINNH